jgi:hypothetical protein
LFRWAKLLYVDVEAGHLGGDAPVELGLHLAVPVRDLEVSDAPYPFMLVNSDEPQNGLAPGGVGMASNAPGSLMC